MSLSTKIKTAVMAVAVAMGGLAVLAPQMAYACDCANVKTDTTCTAQDKVKCGMKDTGQESQTTLDATVKNIINGVLYVVGILAVVMVIIGGVQYTTSGGDSSAVTKAKNTILYGIIGLVIAILAYAIVNFVVDKL